MTGQAWSWKDREVDPTQCIWHWTEPIFAKGEGQGTLATFSSIMPFKLNTAYLFTCFVCFHSLSAFCMVCHVWLENPTHLIYASMEELLKVFFFFSLVIAHIIQTKRTVQWWRWVQLDWWLEGSCKQSSMYYLNFWEWWYVLLDFFIMTSSQFWPEL